MQSKICQVCYKGELMPLEDDCLLVCNLCSSSISYLVENEKTFLQRIR